MQVSTAMSINTTFNLVELFLDIIALIKLDKVKTQ
jgi:hypothetical protein